MKRRTILFSILSLAVSVSCSKFEVSPNHSEKDVSDSSKKIYLSTVDSIGVVSVENVSTMLKSVATSSLTTRTASENPTIEPYLDKEGNVLFYVVNYGENDGFMLISATKDYNPILAFSDTGHFDISATDSNGIAVWVDETTACIENAAYLPAETRQEYRAQWATYLGDKQEYTPVVTRSSDPYVQQVTAEALAQWQAEGYDVYPVQYYIDNQSFLPPIPLYSWPQIEELRNYTSIITYEPLINDSYILVKTISHPNNEFYMLSTAWNQHSPYNSKLVELYGNKEQLLGCTAVALGQILRYYADVPGYNFEAMPDTASASASIPELASFLYDVGRMIGINYEKGDTGGSVVEVKSALNKYGYNSERVKHNIEDVIASLNKGQLVCMFGDNAVDSGGHAWVCDGLKTFGQKYLYRVMVLTDYPDDAGAGPFREWLQTEYSFGWTKLHMNWGARDEKLNGFYLSDEANPTPNNVYTKDRKNLVNIEKKINNSYENKKNFSGIVVIIACYCEQFLQKIWHRYSC